MKILKIIKKFIGYIITTLIILAVILSFYGNTNEYATEYSTYNPEGNGLKALYLLTNKLGYSAERYKKTARFIPENIIVTVFDPMREIILQKKEKKHLLNKVKKGNNLILVTDDEKIINTFKTEESVKNNNIKNGHLYTLGKGLVLVLNSPHKYCNEQFLKGTHPKEFIENLDELSVISSGTNQVYFDEYYLGYSKQGASLLDIMDNGVLMVIVQIILAIILFMYIKSRRFGKADVVLAIEKREENENLFAMANIYTKAKAYNLVLDLYYSIFKKDISKYLGFSYVADNNELTSAANSNDYLKKFNFNNLLANCERAIANNRLKKVEMINLAKMIDGIRKGIS